MSGKCLDLISQTTAVTCNHIFITSVEVENMPKIVV